MENYVIQKISFCLLALFCHFEWIVYITAKSFFVIASFSNQILCLVLERLLTCICYYSLLPFRLTAPNMLKIVISYTSYVAAERQPVIKQRILMRSSTRSSSVTVCDKLQHVWCNQLVVSLCYDKMYCQVYPKSWLANNASRSWQERWDKCVRSEGEYFEED